MLKAKLILLLPAILNPVWSQPSEPSRIPAHSPNLSHQVSHQGTISPMDTATLGGFDVFEDAYLNAIPFFNAAYRAKVKIDPESVSARVAAYAELYPGRAIDSKRVQSLMSAEKYLAAQGKGVSDRDIENRLSALGAEGRIFKEGNREARLQALKAEILFKKEDIIRFGEAVSDLEVLRGQEVMENSRMKWPLESLRLQGPPDECLASLEGECWVTLEEYNAVVGEFRAPRAIPLDTAKATTLRKYLVEKQFAMMEPSPGNGWKEDSILAAMKARKNSMAWHNRSEGMGLRVQNPKVLWETYDRYYRDLFKARMAATVEVVGSTDSTHVDSLYQSLKKWEKQDSISRKAGRKRPEEPPVPWLGFEEEKLPRAITSHTDTLQPGEFTRPVKTNLGFFLARVRDIRRIKEVSFPEAHHQLVYLATRDKFLRMDSVLAAKSLKYYQANRGEFRIPDTLELTAWLVPFRFEGKGKPKEYLLSTHPEKDTLDFTPLKISSLWLPKKWQQELQAICGKKPFPQRKDAGKIFAGPLKGEFGQWYFRIEKIRKAEGVQAYATVKADIIRRLTSPEIELDTLARDSVKEKVILTLGVAKSIRSSEHKKWQSLPAEEIARLIQAGEVDTTGFPGGIKDDLIDFSRLKWAEKNQNMSRNQKHEFLKRIEVDYARLFQP